MSDIIKIKRGLDIKLAGKATRELSTVVISEYALKPTDFIGVYPKMFVKVGDKVKAGTPVFYDKNRENIQFTSPVSGTIKDIIRGEKRVLLDIIIESDGQNASEDFGTESIASLTKESVSSKLLKSGAWAFIKQRPYGIIANPNDTPKAIFISAFDSAPLAPDMDFVVEGKNAEFQAGIDALAKLCPGKIHLNIKANQTKSPVFLNAKNVTINTFDGPHPAGNIGVQINKISPINKGDIYWTVDPQDLIIIGRLFLTGKYNAEKIIALAGSQVKKPCYYKVLVGANIENIVKGTIVEGENRFISGNVLTGNKIDSNGYLSFYHNMLTVIPEGKYHSFFGWLFPRANKHTFHKTGYSWLMPNKEYVSDTNMNGGERAFVMTGEMDKVFPMDILPMQLLKAIIVGDIDQMEQLGIYEVDEEDFALCEYISTSKIEMQSIVRQGLDLIRKEMS